MVNIRLGINHRVGRETWIEVGKINLFDNLDLKIETVRPANAKRRRRPVLRVPLFACPGLDDQLQVCRALWVPACGIG